MFLSSTSFKSTIYMSGFKLSYYKTHITWQLSSKYAVYSLILFYW